MGSLVLDANKVNSYVLPNLAKSKNILDQAYSTSNTLRSNLPGSFNYRSYISDIVNQIYSIKKEVSDIESMISKKIERINSIERVQNDKASSIVRMASQIGGLEGATIGRTIGGVIGATGVVAIKTGEIILNTGAKVAKSVVSNVKKIGLSVIDEFKKVGAKVSKSVKSAVKLINEKIKTATERVENRFNKAEEGILKVLDAAEVSTIKTGEIILNTGAKVAKSVVSNVKKIGLSVIDEFKKVGAKVSKSVKSAAKWVSGKAKTATEWVEDKFNKAKEGVQKALDATGAFFTKVGSKIKAAWNKATDFMKKVGASIANGVISFVKGLVSLVEAVGDLFLLLGAGIDSIVTGLCDIISGIATGNWDWKQTKGLWESTKAAVAYSWTDKAFDAFYNTKVGKTLDKYAYAPFKSDGTACKILEGVGYVAGIVAISCFTGMPPWLIAGLTGFSRSTQEEWNKNSISIDYGGTNIDIQMDYQTYSEIENLKQGESKTITQQIQLEDGSIQELSFKITSKGNGKYDIIDSVGNVATLNSLNESSTLKGLAVGAVRGGWEALQWYLGSKINGAFRSSASPFSKVFGTAARVTLDSADAAVEVPFESLVAMLFEGKSWSEAWKESGGWKAVGVQSSIGALSSGFGEAMDGIGAKITKKKIVSALKNFDGQTDKTLAKKLSKLSDLDVKKLLDRMGDADKLKILQNLEFNRQKKIMEDITGSGKIDAFNRKYPDSLVNGVRKLQDATQVSEYFSDPKGFLATQYGIDAVRNMSDKEMYSFARKNLSKDRFSIFDELYKNRRVYTPEQKELILAFAAYGGPAIDAWLRGVKTTFRGGEFDGFNYRAMNDYFHRSMAAIGASSSLRSMNIEDAVRMLDNIVENSKPLTESLVVTRYVDDIFHDGQRIINPQPGIVFNDKAFFSTSACGSVFGNRKIKLEIEVPAGSRVAYIEPEAAVHTGFHQQEVLLGRNNMYQITDTCFDANTGQYIVKAKMLPMESSIKSAIDVNLSNSKSYYNNYKHLFYNQEDIVDVIDYMNSRGLLAQCEAEIRDMKMSGIYKSGILGHGEEHVEDVIFNAMYIAEKEQFNDREKKLLIEAAKYHDAGKATEGYPHGVQGAETAKNYIKNLSADDIAIVQAAIEYHSIEDNSADFNGILNKYHISGVDRDMTERIANALKDADGLDRSRFPGNLKEELLRTNSGKSLVMASYQLQEARAAKYLDNLLAGSLDESDRKIIEDLRNSQLSDYEIAFWIQYHPSKGRGTIGLWKTINDKVNWVRGGK